MYFNKYKLKRRVSKNELIYKKINLSCCIILILSLMLFTFMNKAHAELTTNKYVEISSLKSEYTIETDPLGWNYNVGRDNTGGWRVTKRAKWTGYGKAELKLNISAVPRYSKKKQDIILVINNTNSKVMPSGNFEKLKDRLVEFSTNHIDNEKGNIALIKFNSGATIINGFTNDVTSLNYNISNMSVTNNSNMSYYKPLLKVDELLSNYTPGANREVVVIFVSGVPPTIDNSLEVGEYEYLSDQYPYLTINAINYSAYAFHSFAGAFAPTATKALNKISKEIIHASLYKENEQPTSTYVMADANHQNPILVAARSRLSFSQFDVSEYINNDYFEIESIEDISNSRGKVTLNVENGDQKVFWSMQDENFVSGTPFNSNQLIIKLKLKDELLDKGGMYPTSSKSIIKTAMPDTPSENINTATTTVLPDNFKVKYEGNSPSGCSASGVPRDEKHSVFATVKISDKVPTCNGYQFNGWKLISNNVEYINDDTFIMPEENVVIRAQWSDLKIKKTMDGNVYTAQTLYDIMRSKAVPDNIDSEFANNEGIEYWWRNHNKKFDGILYDHYTYQYISANDEHKENWNGKGVYLFSDTKDERYPLLFYRGYVDDNNVLFGDICWKMMNTTSTGGVKLVFNGFYIGNACVTTSPSASFGPTPFNYVGNEPKFGSASYMYGKIYDYSQVSSPSETQLPTVSSVKTLNFDYYNTGDTHYVGNKRLYSKSIRYNENAYTDSNGLWHQARTYTLVDPFTIDGDSIPKEDGGLYTCNTFPNSHNNGSDCISVDYIAYYEANKGPSIYLYGKLLDAALTTVYVGDGYTKNSDGTYTLTNPVAYNNLDFYEFTKDFDRIKGKYFCANKTATCAANSYPIVITRVDNSYGNLPIKGISINNNYVYGKNVKYENGVYTLLDTTTISESYENLHRTDINQIEYIYTCATLEKTCDKVKVLTKGGWILLTGGDKKDDIMPNIRANTTSSIAKGQIDSFYQSSILNKGLSDYVEDTVYCNDRSDYMMRTEVYYAMGDNYNVIDGFKPKITCSKEDSFTVSESIGNGALKYPVGLPSYDEMVLAGSNGFIKNTSYLSNNLNWWTMTPYTGHQIINNNSVSSDANYGYIYAQNVNVTSYASFRPVISIKPTVSVNGGDGTAANPYLLKMD